MSAAQNSNAVSVLCLFPTRGTLLTLVVQSLAAWEPFFQDGTCERQLQSYEFYEFYKYITNYCFSLQSTRCFFWHLYQRESLCRRV